MASKLWGVFGSGFRKGDDLMTVFEVVSLLLYVALLILAYLSYRNTRKQAPCAKERLIFELQDAVKILKSGHNRRSGLPTGNAFALLVFIVYLLYAKHSHIAS